MRPLPRFFYRNLRHNTEELRPFHVEEDVFGIRTRQSSNPFSRGSRERLDMVGVGIALGDLKHRLMSKSIEGVRLDARNSGRCGQCRKPADGRDPFLPQPPDLVPRDIGDESDVIDCLPVRLAADLHRHERRRRIAILRVTAIFPGRSIGPRVAQKRPGGQRMLHPLARPAPVTIPSKGGKCSGSC
jgi:hypothetical protein